MVTNPMLYREFTPCISVNSIKGTSSSVTRTFVDVHTNGMSGSVNGLLGSRAQLGHWISNLTNNKTSKTHTRFDIQCPNSTLENSYDYIFIRGALIFLPACFSARIVLEDAGGCGSATIPLLASRTMIAPFAGCSICNNGREVAGLDLERYL